jgi:hypothetical protein
MRFVYNNEMTGTKNPQDFEGHGTGRVLLGHVQWGLIFLFQFFCLDEWTTYDTWFPWTPSASNSDFIWDWRVSVAKRLIIPLFAEELQHAATWPKLPKGCRGRCFGNSLLYPWIFGFSVFRSFRLGSSFVIVNGTTTEVAFFIQRMLEALKCW